MWLWTSNVLFCASKCLCTVSALVPRKRTFNYVLAVGTVWDRESDTVSQNQ